METFLLRHEFAIRLACYVGVFAAMAAAEVLRARRPLRQSKALRWSNNLALTLVNGLVLRAVFPAAAVGAGELAAARDVGFFHAVAAPAWLAIAAATVVALDLAIYAQHRVFHAVPLLWRLHRVHHADLDLDVTTGTRFHPAEILLSMAWKFAVVLAIGAPVAGVLLFEILLNATSQFNHGNVCLPAAADRVLRRITVTPDMHRVHHSIDPGETNTNYGFNLPWWDRLFGTYRDQPAAGHEAMTIGIAQFRAPRELRLDRMLLQPLRDDG